MRLWSIHPKYLDSQGLVALWREALLAQAVLRGNTRGYLNHPQLFRFKNCAAPLSAISLYLRGVYEEAVARNYKFDREKILSARKVVSCMVTTGQMEYEWEHLLAKLKIRNPSLYIMWLNTETPDAHPVFTVRIGDIELWERKRE